MFKVISKSIKQKLYIIDFEHLIEQHKTLAKSLKYVQSYQ